MKREKKLSIIKYSIIGVVLIYGLILSFCSFNIGLTTFHSTTSAIKLGLDLKGGVYAVYEMDETETTDNLSQRMDGTRTRLQNLLSGKGYTEATVVREGSSRLRIEVPDVDDPGNLFDIIGKPATLEFVLDKTGEVVLTGKNILKAEPQYSTQDSGYVVALSLDAAGTEAFGKATAANIGETMSIKSTIPGEEPKTISSPKIESAITDGKAIINGMESQAAAQNLADQIASGQFEVKLSLLESNTVSPTLGDKALMLGVIAGAIGLLLVMVFLCVVYRGLGAAASIALVFYTIIVLFFLAVLPWVQLTLPGIAGIILSLGMAVDANIIIFERIKDEYRNGKSVKASTYAGFKKATSSIVDSNVTTIIAAVVLLIFGTGSIQGFALTLLVGIVVSLFSSLFVSRKLIKYLLPFVKDSSKNEDNSNGEVEEYNKFFGLKRGKNYLTNNADDNKSVTAQKATKTEIKSDDINSKKKEGGLANENI